MLAQRTKKLFNSVRRELWPTIYESNARKNKIRAYPEAQLRTEGYCSQYGQDKLVHETLLPDVVKGVFVDIGAHDGQSLSNTCYFERSLGWRGLCVEPIPEVFALLDRNRHCHKVQGAVGTKRSRAQFQVLTGPAEMLSGLQETYDPRHLARIDREQIAGGGQRRLIDVEVFTLAELLDRFQLTRVDYLSIDTEGAELAILQGIDFSRYDIRVIGLENNYRDGRPFDLLVAHGYRLRSVLGDEFYVKQ